MAQKALNSADNINIPHVVSGWFQQDFAGDWVELGDLRIDGVNATPDFYEHRSYRNSINALRKKLVMAKNAVVNLVLNEPNILNMQRVLFGGTIQSGQELDAYEGRIFTTKEDDGGVHIDLADADQTAFESITVTGIYLDTDVLLGTNLISGDIRLDTDGKAYFDATDAGIGAGVSVYVRFDRTETGLYSSAIFGASNATIEGAGRLQLLNDQGGVLQIWELSSVTLAPNGDITYPLDAHQEIPMTWTLQERSGAYGTIYTK